MSAAAYRRRSKVWLAFSIEGENDDKAVCKICEEELTRTADDVSNKCATTRLWKHVNQKHPEVSKMLSGISQDDVDNEGILDRWNMVALQKLSNRGFTSKVWRFFDLDEEDRNIAICCECNVRISRGCDKNTTSMWNHMKYKHAELYNATQNEKLEIPANIPDEKTEQGTVKDEFLLYSVRQNAYICKTCAMIIRLESPVESVNTGRLVKHLDHIFHKRVQHGLEPPKRPIVPRRGRKSNSTEKLEQESEPTKASRKLPMPVPFESIIADREVDLIHSGVMMRTLYIQQKRDLCCDCTILLPHKETPKKQTTERVAVRDDDKESIKYYETNTGYEFKVHSCVLAIASDKMKTVVEESLTNAVMMHDISKDAMLGFIEIAYLGKLSHLMDTDNSLIWEIYVTAQSFNSKLVTKYLERECCHIISRYKKNSDKPAYDKFSIYLSPDSTKADVSKTNSDNSMGEDDQNSFIDHNATIDDSTMDDPSPSGLSLLGLTDMLRTDLPNKRKRRPLSSQFKLKVSKRKRKKTVVATVEVAIPKIEDDLYHTEQPRFEIKGDTAILRPSPEHFTENGEHENLFLDEKIT